MNNSIASCGFYLQAKGIPLDILSGLPKRLSGLDRGVVTRLSADGIIAKHGRIYEGRAWRRTWKAGPRYGSFMRWISEHESI